MIETIRALISLTKDEYAAKAGYEALAILLNRCGESQDWTPEYLESIITTNDGESALGIILLAM